MQDFVGLVVRNISVFRVLVDNFSFDNAHFHLVCRHRNESYEFSGTISHDSGIGITAQEAIQSHRNPEVMRRHVLIRLT